MENDELFLIKKEKKENIKEENNENKKMNILKKNIKSQWQVKFKNYIKNCVYCAKMKTIEKSKREKNNNYIITWSRYRYFDDLWYLP